MSSSRLLSNVSYGKGTRRFGEIYNKYVKEVTIPVGRIPLARLICTVFPEAEVSQSTPAEITTIRHVCKGKKNNIISQVFSLLSRNASQWYVLN